MFQTYLQLGFDHILDPQGYDHILFVLVLCSIFSLQEWKKVLILVTAFTLGHSVTLALSTLNIVTFPANIVEVLIPVTIILTAIYNVFMVSTNRQSNSVLYALPAVFGLIHGMGFSNYLKALLSPDESPFMPLLAFNIGVELGQVIIVIVSLFLNYILVRWLGMKAKYWTYFISVIAIGVALMLLLERV